MSKKYFAAIAQQDADLNIKMRVGKNWPRYAEKVYRENYLNVSLRNVKAIKVDSPKTKEEDVKTYSVDSWGYKGVKKGLHHIPADERLQDNRYLLKYLREQNLLSEETKGKTKVIRFYESTEVLLKSNGQTLLVIKMRNKKTFNHWG